MEEKKNYIRFINSDYKTLFHLPDGGHIRITYPDGKQMDRVCQFLDECHTKIGHDIFHICEFAERMERIGAKYQPLDYIRDLDFYRKRFFAATEGNRGPAYYIIDESETHGFAFAPKGAEKGKKYCVFELERGIVGPVPGKVVEWSGRLYDMRPSEWGLDPAKIKGITQREKSRQGPKQSCPPKKKR